MIGGWLPTSQAQSRQYRTASPSTLMTASGRTLPSCLARHEQGVIARIGVAGRAIKRCDAISVTSKQPDDLRGSITEAAGGRRVALVHDHRAVGPAGECCVRAPQHQQLRTLYIGFDQIHPLQ